MLLEKLPKAYFEGIGFQEPRLEAMEPITNVIGDEPCSCKKKSKTVTCIFMCAIKEFEFEYCKSHSPLPLRLLRRHLFPLTPTVPGIAIHLDVMRSIHNLRFLCHLSMHSVVTYFEAHFHQKVPASLKARLSEALPFYERMMLNVEKILRCECQVDDVCPGCVFLQGRKGIAADGNFQLRRFKRAQDPPGVVFEGADVVDSLWTDTTVPHSANSSKSGCGSWNALEKQGGRLTGVDETGVFGITCDHGFPFAFLDMKTRGEKFEYVLSTLAKVVQHPLYDERIRIMYDVGCKIGPA
ncbi:hypothetical protein BJV82DRAFT_675969 [Fennellomyces sp. T-0311]|nr:hypothetical protein BJV82DRAFT_675969 [Fennellomyces sp. T-0311]